MTGNTDWDKGHLEAGEEIAAAVVRKAKEDARPQNPSARALF